MNLPRAEEAVVPRNKVENYLLDRAHPVGGGKARFFCGSDSVGKSGMFWPRRSAGMAARIRWHIPFQMPMA